jgi:hypothetical protein
MKEPMEDLLDLKSLYGHLEKRATDYEHSSQIGELFQKLRDLKHRQNNPAETEIAQWEIDFFNFSPVDGKLNPRFTRTNEKGDVIEYPSLERFDNRTHEYLVMRLDHTSNPLLRARYSHILWSSPKKHAEYAKIAVESYLKLVKIYEAKDKTEPQKHFGLDVLEAIKNAYAITNTVKYKSDRVRSEIRRLIRSSGFESNWSFVLRTDLIGLMLRDKKRFSSKDFFGFQDICWKTSEALTNSNIHAAITMLELGEKIDRKLGKETHEWRKRIAESYEVLTNREDLASLTFCQLALEQYRIMKNEGKVKELEEKYSKLKDKMHLKIIKTEIDLTEQIEKFREFAHRIAQGEPVEIVSFLMLEKKLLPQHAAVEKFAEELGRQYALQDLISKEIIDESGHPAEHFSDEGERKYYRILHQYYLELKLVRMPLINEIFFAAIRENKLSTKVLVEFFKKHSWFGKNIPKKLLNDETIQYSWLNLIAPALNEYFIQMQYYFQNPAIRPNLVLCIDSLTLKIEGLLRDICRFAGVTTFSMKKDRKGRNVVREKDIHALLHEESVKKLFDEDDLLFFRFLLVEKAGFNLRHRIAHSLMLFQEYSVIYMHLLIIALLRLGKYDFVKKEASSTNQLT